MIAAAGKYYREADQSKNAGQRRTACRHANLQWSIHDNFRRGIGTLIAEFCRNRLKADATSTDQKPVIPVIGMGQLAVL